MSEMLTWLKLKRYWIKLSKNTKSNQFAMQNSLDFNVGFAIEKSEDQIYSDISGKKDQKSFSLTIFTLIFF